MTTVEVRVAPTFQDAAFPTMLVEVLAALVALVAFGKMLLSLTKKVKGNNPFSSDTRRSPAPYVANESARDKVIKQPYTLKNLPQNIDAIVIGRYLHVY